jgi:hypothetical protein
MVRVVRCRVVDAGTLTQAHRLMRKAATAAVKSDGSPQLPRLHRGGLVGRLLLAKTDASNVAAFVAIFTIGLATGFDAKCIQEAALGPCYRLHSCSCPMCHITCTSLSEIDDRTMQDGWYDFVASEVFQDTINVTNAASMCQVTPTQSPRLLHFPPHSRFHSPVARSLSVTLSFP